MKKPFYLFNPGVLSRKDNTLKYTAISEEGTPGGSRYLPVESVEELYIFGSLDVNSALLNFLGQQGISVHFFNYYQHYTGSFMPREYLLAGKVQVLQTRAYLEKKRRMPMARLILEGASFNMLHILRYYQRRGRDLSQAIEQIEGFRASFEQVGSPAELMGLEGNIRKVYYESFDQILQQFQMGGRSKKPPKNEVNALISFGNMLCYTQCLKQIYHTQLNPTISFLHEPGYRRYSLALDLAEIFKPLLVDRMIFSLVNKKVLKANDFRWDLNQCVLKKSSAQKLVRHWDERLQETIQHRVLDKKVSYGRLIRLECYKLVKHLLGDGEYKPFKIWW